MAAAPTRQEILKAKWQKREETFTPVSNDDPHKVDVDSEGILRTESHFGKNTQHLISYVVMN